MKKIQILFIIITIIIITTIIYKLYKLYQLYPNYKPNYQLSAHHAKVLLLSCMDFRLIDDTALFFILSGELNNYDQFILAGASLGYNADTDWAKVFEKHINIASSLHNIEYIYILDHLGCGMYKKHYGEKINNANEIALHNENMKTCIDKLESKYPGRFKYKSFIMDLHGKII